jgi:hypothetical protein
MTEVRLVARCQSLRVKVISIQGRPSSSEWNRAMWVTFGGQPD